MVLPASFIYNVIVFLLATMKCIVCIGADYPLTPPVFAIKVVGKREVPEIQIKVCL